MPTEAGRARGKSVDAWVCVLAESLLRHARQRLLVKSRLLASRKPALARLCLLPALLDLLERGGGVLHAIDLKGCAQLTSLGVMGFRRGVGTMQLRRLELGGGARVGDSAMGWIASGCKLLDTLGLPTVAVAVGSDGGSTEHADTFSGVSTG